MKRLILIIGLQLWAFFAFCQTVTYEYDELDQITRAVFADGTQITFEYDQVMNMVQQNVIVQNIIYVRKDGNDANNGFTGNATGAKLTIQAAVDAAAEDGIIVINAGIYNETVTITKNLKFRGVGLPAIQNLTLNGASKTLTFDNGAIGITQLVKLTNGYLASNGNLNLLSDANGTAMLTPFSAFTSVDGFITVKRYFPHNASLGATAGLGNHYISTPVETTFFSELANFMSLILNTAFNSNPNPAYTVPFPTLYEYVENVGGVIKGLYDGFTAGFQVPTTATFKRGVAYVANTNTNITLSFSGKPNDGDISVAVTKRNTGTEQGWNGLGNPYPSPIDWDLFIADPANAALLENAVYFRVPTAQYTGTWSSYVNGVGTNGATKDIALGQGFLVRAKGNGNVMFKNAFRPTSYQNPTFFRTEGEKSEKTGLVKLLLKGNGSADETAIYFEKDATAFFDSKFDAAKVQTNAGVTLYTRIANQKISINGLPDFEDKTEIPLIFYVPSNGNYTFEVSELAFFAPKSFIYLEDKLTNKLIDLQETPKYVFSANTGTVDNRFVLRFSKPLPELQDENIILYPNPTAGDLNLRFLNNYEGEITIRIFDQLGKTFQTVETKKGKYVMEQNLNVSDLAKGLYILEIQTDRQKIAKKFFKQ